MKEGVLLIWFLTLVIKETDTKFPKKSLQKSLII
jgi:hypothetical protein